MPCGEFAVYTLRQSHCGCRISWPNLAKKICEQAPVHCSTNLSSFSNLPKTIHAKILRTAATVLCSFYSTAGSNILLQYPLLVISRTLFPRRDVAVVHAPQLVEILNCWLRPPDDRLTSSVFFILLPPFADRIKPVFFFVFLTSSLASKEAT